MGTHDPLEEALTRQLLRFRCPDPHVLGEFSLGVLEEGQEDVRAHVTQCPRCQEELAALEGFLRVRDRPDLRVVVARWVPTLRVAEPAPAYALRGDLQLTSATYQAGEFTVAVSVTEDPEEADLRTLVGTVSAQGEVPEGGTARLVGPGSWRATEVDPAGQFAFDAVPPGRYTLEVEVGDTLLHVAPLEVS